MVRMQGSMEAVLTAAAALQQGAGAARPKLVVVDDLPHAAGPDARRRLANALGELAATARFPVVVVTTESGGSGAGGDRGGGGGGGSFLQGGLAKVCASQHITLGNPALCSVAFFFFPSSMNIPSMPDASEPGTCNGQV